MARKRACGQSPREERGEKLVVCVCGMAGCGKSTVARGLARKYGLKYFSGGEALKALAADAGYEPGGRGWWETREGKKFLRQRSENPEFDRGVDEKLKKWAERGNVVLDSWTMPWLLKGGFNVWLEASPEERAKRIAGRSGVSPENALKALKERDDGTKAIYKKLYGFDLGDDFSPFHLVIDTDQLEADEVFRVLCLVIDRLYIRKERP